MYYLKSVYLYEMLLICKYIQSTYKQFPPNDTEFCETLNIYMRFHNFCICLGCVVARDQVEFL
jgi:hypothetical protein